MNPAIYYIPRIAPYYPQESTPPPITLEPIEVIQVPAIPERPPEYQEAAESYSSVVMPIVGMLAAIVFVMLTIPRR